MRATLACHFRTNARIITALAALLAGACSNPTGSDQAAAQSASINSYPTLLVAQERQIEITNVPPTLHFPARAGIQLDLAKSHLLRQTNSIPDMVQLVLNSSIYKLARPVTTNLYIIHAATLEPLRGEPFTGFRSGDHGMLGIGHTMPERLEKDSFSVSWVAGFTVE